MKIEVRFTGTEEELERVFDKLDEVTTEWEIIEV